MLTVSNYHYIREDFTAAYPSIFGLTPVAFQKQLEALKEIGDFVSSQELISNFTEILSDKKNYFLVTFDDGLREQFELAKPVLEELKIPAIFFVNTINFKEREISLVHKIHLLRSHIPSKKVLSNIFEEFGDQGLELTESEKSKAVEHYNYDNKDSAYLKYILNFKLSFQDQQRVIDRLFHQNFESEKIASDLYMSQEQLKELANLGWLGSHSHSHRPLGLLKVQEIEQELSDSKQYLESITGEIIHNLSYPYGSPEACASPVSSIAKETGYKLGFTMERGINMLGQDPLLLKRFDCNDLPLGKNEKAFKDACSLIYK